MSDETRNDLKIAGSTTVAGGTFNQVTVAGQAEINGDLDCIDFKVSGSSEVKGNLKAKTLRINGHTAVVGKVESDEVKISGSFNGRGDLAVKKIKVSGHADVTGDISAELIEISGYLTVRGDCEAESFAATGAVSVERMLNAGIIEVRHYGSSRAREIGGEKISIRTHYPFGLQRLIKFFRPPGKFSVEAIEGDDIHLEQVRAKVVRGDNVTVGSGCEIEVVEYRDSFEKDKNARVGEPRKMITE